MRNIARFTYGELLVAAKSFYSNIIKTAYRVAPYKAPTFDPNDAPKVVAFRIHDKVYYAEPKKGETMHALLLANLPEETQEEIFDTSEENDDICAGFFSKNGCFYTREQNRKFFGFDKSENGLAETQEAIKNKNK